jgi:hypothetical protein
MVLSDALAQGTLYIQAIQQHDSKLTKFSKAFLDLVKAHFFDLLAADFDRLIRRLISNQICKLHSTKVSSPLLNSIGSVLEP